MVLRSLGFLTSYRCYLYAVRLRLGDKDPIDWNEPKLTRAMYNGWVSKIPVVDMAATYESGNY